MVKRRKGCLFEWKKSTDEGQQLLTLVCFRGWWHPRKGDANGQPKMARVGGGAKKIKRIGFAISIPKTGWIIYIGLPDYQHLKAPYRWSLKHHPKHISIASEPCDLEPQIKGWKCWGALAKSAKKLHRFSGHLEDRCGTAKLIIFGTNPFWGSNNPQNPLPTNSNYR